MYEALCGESGLQTSQVRREVRFGAFASDVRELRNDVTNSLRCRKIMLFKEPTPAERQITQHQWLRRA